MTPIHLANCKSWPAYHLAYLKWMKSVDHPDLRKSNYFADQFRLLNN